ncbi:hypothetical protein AURDEDRAFT_170813 [Auricularia subglabra TFB-10046 SS5]|nr:hypothetical protein AURDEDRAFT_170813 [Auricularia subglabra TFB-10046 SS5]
MAATWTPQQALALLALQPVPTMSYPPYNPHAGYYAQPNNYGLQPRVPVGPVTGNHNPYAVGARVWARVTLDGHVSWGQALILRGLAWMSTALGMRYQIEFSSVPEYGGPAVRNEVMDVPPDQLYDRPPRRF